MVTICGTVIGVIQGLEEPRCKIQSSRRELHREVLDFDGGSFRPSIQQEPTINQLVHLWKFDNDADRRAHWAAVFADHDFVEGFASQGRALVMTRETKSL